MTTFSRNTIRQQIMSAFEQPKMLGSTASDDIEVPEEILSWMTRLQLLKGVPFNYLVPDEQMLPPESIRFFYLDPNWMDALVDGAFSLGRVLNTEGSVSMSLDTSLTPTLSNSVDNNAPKVRANALGVTPPPANLNVISGFVLRSSLVLNYPGMGVNAFPVDGTPTSPTIELLNILRFERLGPESDTMICLVDGDIYQVDIHEAPEALHYGIDKYVPPAQSGSEQSFKMLHTFTKDGSAITMNPNATQMNIGNCFRTVSPRVLMMQNLAQAIATMNNVPVSEVDSAVMGFEMTQGVGNVSFINNTPAQ
ncbi:MAG: hypothetical protein ACRC3B_14005 [Bacteroidia bacterium]